MTLHGSQCQPLVCEIEDLHWIDPSSEAYLSTLARRLSGAAILLLCTFRPGYRPPWMDSASATQIALQPLAPHTSQQTVRTLLQTHPEATTMAPLIVAKAHGNPFFLEELARAAVAQEATPAQWAVPDTIQAVLAARLDQLPALEKRVVQTAALLGADIPVPLLQAVTSLSETDLQACLDHLPATDFLYESRFFPDQTYAFTHVLVQEVAEQSLLRRTRQQLHQQMAEVLTTHFPALAAAQPERLARHYAAAGRWDEAIDAWQQAGQRAVDRSAYPEALAHLTHALDVLKTLPPSPAQAQRELAALMTLGPALVATRGHASPEVAQTYARARVLCEQVGETPRLFPTLRLLCRIALSQGALATARQLGTQLHQLAQRQAAPVPRLEAHDALGVTLFFLGDYALARTHLEQGVALIDLTQQQSLVSRDGVVPGVECCAYSAWTLWCLGYPTQAVQRAQEALALAQALAHPYSVAQAHYWVTFLHQRRRDAPAVLAHAATLLRLATAQEYPLLVGLGSCLQGWALAMQGQGVACLEPMYEGLATVLATGQTLSQPLCLLLLAETAGYVGRMEEGRRLLGEALAAFTASGRGDLLTEAYRLQGPFLLHQAVPDVTRAEACFQQALALARCQEAKMWELRAATSLSRLWQQQGQPQAAYALLAPLVDWFTEGLDTVDVQEARMLLTDLAS